MSYNLSQIMKSAHRNYKKGGKTFSECLKSAWSFAKLQESFSPEAVKSRTDKFLAERHEAMSKTAKATPSKEYNNLNIPASAYYNPNSTHYGAHYTTMDKRTELEIQRDKYEAVIEERDALISSLRGENEKLKRDLESERGFYREKVSQCDDLKKFIESQRNLMDIVLKNNQSIL